MKLSIRGKIYIAIVLLIVLFGGGIYAAASHLLSATLLREYRSRGLLIAENVAAWATEPILAMDLLRLKRLVDEAVSVNDDVKYAFILNNRGEVIVHTFEKGFPTELRAVNEVAPSQKYNRVLLDTGDELIYDFAVPVHIGKDRLGTVRLGLLRTRLNKALMSLSWMMFLATALVVALAGLVAAFLARTVGKRIENLHQSIDQVMRGNLDVKTARRLKRNCWDIMRCTRQDCPAYHEYDLRCWYTAGTLCTSCVEGEYARKIESCRSCPVYQACSGDEIQNLAEAFDVMVRTLKNHLTEIKAVGAALSEHRQLLETVLNATPDFVSLQSPDCVYRAVNKAFCDIMGKSQDEIIGKTAYELFPSPSAEANCREDRLVLKSDKPLTKEEKIGEGAEERWIHFVKIPVRGEDGSTIGLLCSGRDITALKQFQERLTQSQKMEAVGQLTAGIAHEINTPLGIILGYSQLLREEAEPGSQLAKDLETIEKHTHVCKKIVADLLRFSRQSTSRMVPLDINDVLEETVAVVAHTFSLEHVTIEKDLAAHLPKVTGDEDKLEQAVVNLLNNAFDAIGSDGGIVLSSALSRDGKQVLFSVADNGPGIAAENLDRVFDPFFTTKGVGEGTGLGLSVTFGIIKDHGGKIEVQSPLPPALARRLGPRASGGAPAKGTVFTVSIPAITLPEETHGEDGEDTDGQNRRGG